MEYVSKKEFEDLRNLVYSLISRIDNDKFYDKADKNGIRQTEGIHSGEIEANTTDISDVRTAIEEVYEMVLTEGE